MRGLWINIVVTAFLAATTIFFPHKCDASTRRELRKFKKVINTLDKEYIDTLDISRLIDGAIESVLSQTDPYSQYMSREGNTFFMENIERGAIDNAYLIDDSVAYIKIGIFSRNCASDFLLRYRDLGSPDTILLDLRGNNGGLVQEAVDLVDLFFEGGVAIFHRKGRVGTPKNIYRTDGSGVLLDARLILLIDSETASASEIVAAAFQDNRRATIVGERSAGKGLILNRYSLPDGSTILIATAQYTSPSDSVIQRAYLGRKLFDSVGGVDPDVFYLSDEPIDSKEFIKLSVMITDL